MIELDTSALPSSKLKDMKDALTLTVHVSFLESNGVTVTITRKLA